MNIVCEYTTNCRCFFFVSTSDTASLYKKNCGIVEDHKERLLSQKKKPSLKCQHRNDV